MLRFVKVEADPVDPNQDMGDPDANVSEEDIEKSNDLKREAVEQFGEGKFDESISKYTEAIKLNPGIIYGPINLNF